MQSDVTVFWLFGFLNAGLEETKQARGQNRDGQRKQRAGDGRDRRLHLPDQQLLSEHAPGKLRASLGQPQFLDREDASRRKLGFLRVQIWLRGQQKKVGRLSAGSKIVSLLTANDIVLCGTENGLIKVPFFHRFLSVFIAS